MNEHTTEQLLAAAQDEISRIKPSLMVHALIRARADQLSYEQRSESLAERLDKAQREIAAATAILTLALDTYPCDLVELCDIARIRLKR